MVPKEREEGYQAYVDGVDYYDNPYPKSSGEACEWGKGWDEAKGRCLVFSKECHQEGEEVG